MYTHFVVLKPLNGDGKWMVPAADIVLRMEKTIATRPAGKLNSPLLSPPRALVDALLDTATFGNPGVFRNEVIILDSLSGFKEFVESVSLELPTSQHLFPSLASLLPFGSLERPSPAHASWWTKWDERSSSGEPLLTVAHSAEALANFCIDVPAGAARIVVNGLKRIKDLQSFDDIGQTQRLCLFADEDDEELVKALADRGCRIWRVTSAELETGARSEAEEGNLLGNIRLSARNRANLSLRAQRCQNENLERAFGLLSGLARASQSDDDPRARLEWHAWRLLNSACSALQPLGAEEREGFTADLNTFHLGLKQQAAWLAPPSLASLQGFARSLMDAALAPDLGLTKGETAQRVMKEAVRAGLKVALLLRHERHSHSVNTWLRRTGGLGSIKVYTARTLPDDEMFDLVVCLSWLGSDVLERIVKSGVAGRIDLIGYSFEADWLTQFTRRVARVATVQGLTASEKANLVQLARTSIEPQQTAPAVEGVPNDEASDVWNVEQRLRSVRKGTASVPTSATDVLPARYVSFVGDSYAFLTPTHRLAVVTGLLAGPATKAQRIPERVVGDIRSGDYLAFPESGDRELIQEKADQLLGASAPGLRRHARLWKDALRRCDMSPETFLQHAIDLRRPRHIATIRNWYADTAQIGPGLGNEDLEQDLELIELITGDLPLRQHLADVIAAVREIRSAHLKAGMRLRDVLMERLPKVLRTIEDEETLVELAELGSAWVVQVESIAPQNEGRGRGEVNRLLREHHDHSGSFNF